MSAQAVYYPVNGYRLAALEWQPDRPVKVIASHGWLDNAASFNRLAPLLEHCHVIALDLGGHGHSDHRPPKATYNIWDDLTDLLAVADRHGWERFHLLGHSRGAILSLLLAAAWPERIQSLALLDGLLPEPVTHADTAAQLGRFLRDSCKPSTGQQRGYESLDRAIAVRRKAAGMSETSARPILERALVERDGRYYWRSDPRLRNASAFKLTDAHNRAVLDALDVPVVTVLSALGQWEHALTLLRDYPKLNPVIMENASHHSHMEDEASAIAEQLNGFYRGLVPAG